MPNAEASAKSSSALPPKWSSSSWASCSVTVRRSLLLYIYTSISYFAFPVPLLLPALTRPINPDRLHRRIWNNRWPSLGQDCHPAQRTAEQNGRHLPALQCPSQPDRELGESAVACSWLRDHHCGASTPPPCTKGLLLWSCVFFKTFLKTTSSGILDHEEARRKNVGGKLLGYVY